MVPKGFHPLDARFILLTVRTDRSVGHNYNNIYIPFLLRPPPNVERSYAPDKVVCPKG